MGEIFMNLLRAYIELLFKLPREQQKEIVFESSDSNVTFARKNTFNKHF